MANPFDQFDTIQPPAPAAQPVVVGTPRPDKPQAPPSGFRWTQEGNLEAIPGGPGDKPEKAGGDKQPGVEQGKAAGYYNRAIRANDEYEALGVGPESGLTAVGKAIVPDKLEGYVIPQGRLQADAYIRDFVAAALRYESGAAIPIDEMDEAMRRYFPQPGEGPDVVEAKRRLRQNTIESLRMGAGPAAEQVAPPEEADRSTGLMKAPGAGEVNVNSETQTVTDEALAAIAPQVGLMVTRGIPRGQIERYMREKGVDPAVVANFRDIIRQRADRNSVVARWIRENPDQPYPIIPTYEVPLTGLDKTAAWISSGPVGAAGIAAGNVWTGNRLDNIVGAMGGDAEMANVLMQDVREQHPYASLAGDVAGGLSLYGAGRAGTNALLSRAPNVQRYLSGTNALSPGAMAGDAALGGYIGSGGGGTDFWSTYDAIMGAGVGTLGGIGGRGAANALGATMSPTGGRLAPIYAEGGTPTIGQRMGAAEGPISGPLGRGVNRAEQAFASIPIVGSVQRSARNAAIDDMQRGAFNQALREIDLQLPRGVKKGTQAHAFMQNAFDKVYDTARSQMSFRTDPQFKADFSAVLKDVELLSQDSQNAFFRLAENVGQRFQKRGQMLTGDDYKNFVSRIDRKVRGIRKNPNGDQELADALEGLALALDDGARRHSPAEAVDLLNKADRGYAKSVIIEDAARRRGGDAGEFSGVQLDAAVQNMSGGIRSRRYLRGQALMQEYAEAAKALGDTVPDSGTFERLATTGAMAGATQLIHPAAAAPWIANTMANLPGVRQGVNAVIAPNRKALAPARRFLERQAKLGSLFGIVAAEQVAQ